MRKVALLLALAAAAPAAACDRQSKPVVVDLARARYPQTTLHIETAIRDGSPRVLHIQRSGADRRRDAWGPLVPTLDADGDGETDDRDEWPMAFTREGGRTANIAYNAASDNRGAGSVIGAVVRPFCNGQAFRVKDVGRRRRSTRIVIAAERGRSVHRVVRVKG
jgi:hypothetical protein